MVNNGFASYAMTDSDGEGRTYQEPEKSDNRSAYKRDSDRITFSDYYRRLEGKAQVIIAYSGDNFRKRLTHTLDVAKISISICDELNLNRDLAEAIAHAHDLGHTPFGHIGEKILDSKMKQFGLHFEHNEQSLRVVEKLDKSYPGFDGLNLTKAVREGMMKHKTSWDNRDIEFEHAPHLEAQAVDLADEIAYTSHDIYDGYNAGLISLESLSDQPLWISTIKIVEKTYGKIEDKKRFLKRCVSSLIGYLLNDLYKESKKWLKEYNISSVEEVRNFKGRLIKFSEKTREDLKKMRDFLMDNFYSSNKVREKLIFGEKVINDLFDAYYNDSTLIPEEQLQEIGKGEKKEIVIKDYIAGMTDKYATDKWEELNKK